MAEAINLALLRLTKRAEMADPQTLVNTFVDTGMLGALLASRDHQIIYGRRGTGKTHALIYLSEKKRDIGDLPIYIDMRTIGSSVGIFGDDSIPLSERATRLLRDTLAAIHGKLFEYAVENSGHLNLGVVGEQLDAFIEASTETQVSGTVADEAQVGRSEKDERATSLGLSASVKNFTGSANISDKAETGVYEQHKITSSGQIRHRVRFGAIDQALSKIAETITPNRIWILLDEWSAIPLELQPFLADLIRRCMLPVRGISIKIAAIEQRSQFGISGVRGDYVGIEVGADMTADLNLDDFMVFDNDSSRSVSFFRRLIFNHYRSAQEENGEQPAATDESTFVKLAFTQRNALEELARAAEGVPRDAINLIAICAQKAGVNSISVGSARAAAKTWYQRDKESAVSSNMHARALLHWIIDEVIAHRRARAFLLLSTTRDALIDALFDARVLHLLKRNISAADQPGVRYDAYKIDYGCYVDLLTTVREPGGLFPAGEVDETAGGFIDVPPDDYRAIRRAILDLSHFAQSGASGANQQVGSDVPASNDTTATG
ncbi:hypothetical protein [Burkholderia glumae]|uniref:ORC-CDC6 family AAA ATPase n=1 Tax=Burkholderia glumae TaxID=337 RepID=UPI001872557B|nr:hypothetical protein [Burkholderia glumae]MCQ0034649.1 hypothetical protein [Burkholderia glumae]MCQ0040201.1 hypothetical protein [Burkholderia glumae]